MRTTSGEFMDKRVMELSGSRRGDFYDHDDDDDDSHDFSFYPTMASHPSSSITEKEWIRFNEALLSLIEKKMKESNADVLHAVEGVSARLSQLETRTRRLENSVEELKDSMECNQGKTEGKLREIEGLLREVQGCTKDIRDKQDIALARVELFKLRLETEEQDGNHGASSHASPADANLSAAPAIQPQTLPPQPPAPSFLSDVPYMPPLANPLPVLPTAAPQFPIPLHDNRNPFLLGDDSPYRSPSYSFENSSQPFQVLPPPPPPVLQPLPPQPMLLSESVHCRLSDFSHGPPQSYRESSPPPFLTPPLMSPLTHPVQVQPFKTHSREPSSPYLHPPNESNYSGSNFQAINQSFQDSRSSLTSDSGGSHTRLPVPVVLPHALPTASFIDSDSPGHETRNGVAMEDVVDRVVSMGFRRDLVASTVKRLRERGQPMDLNTVLDAMMNSGDPMNPNRRMRQ
ncbi:hypothetical protein MLD38_012570 [Melastoma candidum]|uniref:Uncharacterized protein n=1 Tax=Melastoma candidum TaxID=119954 RepID=A0ACB9R6S4_9MYRT|nr:hypothetical protein MLD38_012570 [Melastoma candidum]